MLALTATANKRVEADILQQIGVETQVVRGTMQRPNLYLNVVRVSGDWSKLCYLAEVLRHRTDTGIIYTATQSTAVMVATFLRQQGLNAEYYHADREESVRWDIEQKLIANEYNVVCSTNALGMGIDKPDIRFVVHYHVPASPIYYYQEVGRAGRDGKLAWCILLYDPADLTIQEHLMRKDRLKEENDPVHSQRRQELSDMQSYAQTDGCYVQYLTTYLGDRVGYPCGTCGHCQRENFPVITPSEGIQSGAIHFLQEGFLPYIEKWSTEDCPVHEAGWSLSYHGWSRIGKLVRASKYENAGPFALGLVYQAVELVRARYPIHTISGVVSVPPTKSGLLVEMFARQVASLLNVEYLPVLTKVRPTEEQKNPTNRAQKAENVKGAFSVISPQFVADRSLLLIDDIYDSGYTLREVGQTLMQAGAKAVYPLTITRTLHSDKQ